MRALRAVEALMKDGKERIDHEIWRDCRMAGYVSSLSTIQHGRLALSEAKILRATGATRLTPDNASSRVWVLKKKNPKTKGG
jgi:hypothetical protein